MSKDKIIIKKKMYKIDEMSKPLAWIIEKIRSLEPEINKHILKILLFKKKSTWKKSIANWLVDISVYTAKPKDNFLKKNQYFEYLYNEPFENGNKMYKQTTIYKYCSIILNDQKYLKMKTSYRKELIPIEEWSKVIKYFYIEVDDYLSKGILDIEMANYLIEEFIIKKV